MVYLLVPAQKNVKIIGDDAVIFDGAVQTARTGAMLQDIPKRNAVFPQQRRFS